MAHSSWRYEVQAALLAGLLTAPQATQMFAQQPQPTFRLGVNLVTLDVRRTQQIDVQVRRPGIQVRSRGWYRTKGQPTSSPKR